MGYLRWLASSRVWSRRRSSDRRASLICCRSTHQPADLLAIAGPFGLPLGGLVVVAAVAQLVVLELEQEAGDLVVECAGSSPRASGPGLAYNARASAAVSSSSASSRAAESNGGWMPWSLGARWRTIARNSSRATVLGSWSGPSSSTTRSCWSGTSRSSRSSSASTGVTARRMSWIGSASGDDRTASAVIRTPRPGSRPGVRRDRIAGRPLEDLAQDALLDARHAPDLAERLVTAERVGGCRGWPASRPRRSRSARRAS